MNELLIAALILFCCMTAGYAVFAVTAAVCVACFKVAERFKR